MKIGPGKKVVLTIKKKVQIAGTGPAYGKSLPMEEDIYFPFLHGARDFYNTPIKNNRALDLFSGTGSVGLHLQKMGFEVTSLDISKVGDPTLVQDNKVGLHNIPTQIF